ncbi:DUF262 domain-containing protein [Saprospira grandis]|nr:DUF262 domain-containing protein [Saprospira grandis]
MNISFGELVNMYRDNELIIRPEYQRLYRWTEDQKTALIESILLAIPIPPIFVLEVEDGRWEIIDGLQRTATIISFLGKLSEAKNYSITPRLEDEDEGEEHVTEGGMNKWKLAKAILLPALEGYGFYDLPRKLQLNIKRAVCRVEILRSYTGKVMRFELFKRLNSGGSKLKPQEIRNAIFRTEDNGVRVADMLLELSQKDSFLRLVGNQLSAAEKQELYNQELVLRFLAYSNGRHQSISDKMEVFLDNFMQKLSKNPSFEKEPFVSNFEKVFNLLLELGDENIFKNQGGQFTPALFDGICIGLEQNFERFVDDYDALRRKIEELKEDAVFRQASGSASNSRSRTRNRLTRAVSLFSE